MKSYLSFGGGVNSVAMMLMLLDQKAEFEAIFVDHKTDYPETYEYLDMFQKWLKRNGHKKITILKPNVYRKNTQENFNSLYDYCWSRSLVPSFHRWCTSDFKVKPINKYVKTPCFMFMGIDFGEIKRAKISNIKGIEKRYPLVEHEIDRQGCKNIISNHMLPIPIKSGCYICPFQRKSQWIELRKKHPDLFCKAQQLEERNMEYRKARGKKPLTLSGSGKNLETIVGEKQNVLALFEEEKYPPCECVL